MKYERLKSKVEYDIEMMQEVGRRVVVEQTEGGVLLRPIANDATPAPTVATDEPPTKPTGWRKLFSR